MQDLDKTLREVNKNYGEYILQKEIASIIKGQYFIRNYLVSKEKQLRTNESFFAAALETKNIDKKDWQILNILAKNSREKITNISQSINLSLDAIAKRINNLKKSQTIQHFNIVPNEEVYPYLHYKILLKVKNISENEEAKLYLFSKLQENIVYLVKAVGPWDFELDIEIEDPRPNSFYKIYYVFL